MWFSFTRFKFATFRLGQFKIPYDRYRAQSFAALSLVDWAPTTRMFGSERQVGAEMLASGGFLNLEYAVGIFSGVNARASHGVAISEVYGNAPNNPSEFGSGEVVSSFHPELAGRVAKNFGQINTDTNSDVTGSKKLRHSVGAGIAWDARPVATQDLGLRLSAEWLGKISHLHMNFISYLAWYKSWQGGKILFGPMGFMAETGYRFSLTWELALRYSMTYLTPWLRSDSRSYGAFQIANATPTRRPRSNNMVRTASKPRTTSWRSRAPRTSSETASRSLPKLRGSLSAGRQGDETAFCSTCSFSSCSDFGRG